MSEAAKLKGFVDRIERLMDERDGLLADIREVLDDAKAAHFVPKVLRTLIRRRRAKDPTALAAEDDLLETYQGMLSGPLARAVTMATQGATADEIEQATGIDRSTAARSVSLKNKSETRAKDNLVRENKAPAPMPVAEPACDEAVAQPVALNCKADCLNQCMFPESCGAEQSVGQASAEGGPPPSEGATNPQHTPQDPEDDLAIPPDLDRRHELRTSA